MPHPPRLLLSAVAAGLLAALGAHAAGPVDDARALLEWVASTQDNAGLNYVVVDKRRATVSVLNGRGQLLGSSPVLLGVAVGDDSAPDIGTRPMAQVLPHERTTPAGRFLAEPGHNAKGEDIVWVDYDSAVSMHRVRLANPGDRRLHRLATPTVADNRISYGCINVPVKFYDKILSPAMTGRGGVIYVLPETRPWQQVFLPSRPGVVAPQPLQQ